MSQMQLYKKRDFGEMFNDSFKFLKDNFKHFYGNLFKVIGIPVFVLIVLLFIASRYFEMFYMNVIEGVNYDMNQVAGGPFAVITTIGFTVIVALVISALVFSYTPVYFLLYRDNGVDFNSKDIIRTLNRFKWRILKFMLILFLLLLATITVLGILFSLLVGLISAGGSLFFGLLLLVFLALLLASFILIPYVTLSIHNAFITYVSSDSRFWESFNYGFSLTRMAFWKNVGTALLYSFLIRIVLGIIFAIPFYIIFFGQAMTNIDDATLMTTGIMSTMFWQYASQLITEYIISPMVQINYSIIYFSNVESDTHHSSFDELEQIGKY